MTNKINIKRKEESAKWSVVVIILWGILVAELACSPIMPSTTPHTVSPNTDMATSTLPIDLQNIDSTLTPTSDVPIETWNTVEPDSELFQGQYTIFYSTVSQEKTWTILSIWRTHIDGSDKRLLFQDSRQQRAMGTPTPGPLGEMEYYLTDLVASPDRTKLAFIYIATRRGSTGQPNNSVWVMNVDGSNLRELARLDFLSTLCWSPDSSKLLFNRKGTYFWADVASGDITEIGEWGAISWSPDGTWLAAALWRAPTEEQGIYIVGLEGWNYLIWSIAEMPDQDIFVSDIAWSPSGDTIAFAIGGTHPGCFAISPEGKNLEEIAIGHCADIKWAPDGKKVSFSLSDNAEYENALYVMELGKKPQPVQKYSLQGLNVWSFDSKAILSYREEGKLEAILLESLTVIHIPTESGLVSFTW